MRWWSWWQLLSVLAARGLAQSATPTVCEDESCRCYKVTRVICNCTRDYDEVTLRPDGAYRLPSATTAIIIEGCARVYFLPNTAQHLVRLQNIELRNVHHIYIHDRALAWSSSSRDNEVNAGIRLVIHNSTINEISSHAIQGHFNEIIISSSRINVIRPYAFSSLTVLKTIQLTDNIFENIETQAFKQFTASNFVLRGGSSKTIPSRFLSDVEVTNLFLMGGFKVDQLCSMAFIVSSAKTVLIENNHIETLEGDGFHMNTRGPITFRNNTVKTVAKGAFLGFNIEPEITSVLGTQELFIDNNTFTYLTPSSLLYNQTTLTLRVNGLNLNTNCVCELKNEWRSTLKEQGGTFSCWYSLESHYVSLPSYVDSRCGAFKQNYWIFVVVGIILVVLVAAAVTFLIVKRENEKKKKLQIVMPDGKTYRETEFHIVVERAELLTTDL